MAAMTKFPRMDALVRLRLERNMTQRQLSSQLGRSPATVAQWERGYCLPSVENLMELAQFFGCSVDTILGRDPPEKVS